MNKIRVDIWQDSFNSEFMGDIAIYNNVKHISSDRLEMLLQQINKIVLELAEQE